jgi:hypothetical protein
LLLWAMTSLVWCLLPGWNEHLTWPDEGI